MNDYQTEYKVDTKLNTQGKNLFINGLYAIALLLLIVSCDYDDEQPYLDEPGQGETATYAISGNDISLNANQLNSSSFYANETNHRTLWAFFSNLIPAEIRPQLVELELFADANDDTEAFVAAINENDLSRWEIGFNLTTVWNDAQEFQESRVAYNSIHEFAHILTLNNDQINVGGSESTCENFFTGEGCSTQSSFINAFFNNYWSDIYNESQSFEIDDDDAFFAFYDKYEDRFVSEYASTNPGEDIADSFTIFVLTDSPSSNQIKDQKVRFFYEYPELVELRTLIRSNMDFEINFGQVSEARLQRMKVRGKELH